jgi:pimeloyl-ACP methyl ester carboxylesterase
MATSTVPYEPFTTADVLRDLEAGRSLPLRPADRLVHLSSPPRPTAGGASFLRSSLAASVLARVHPRLARRSLLRLWFTPWVHPAARLPIVDLPVDVAPWSLGEGENVLRGYTAGSGSTVVLVHGWSGRAADWRHLAADLVAAGHRVVVPDLPAHGSSPGRRTDLFELGDALAEVLVHERPAAVVAHSLGFPTTVLALQHGAPAPATIVAVAPGRRLAHAVAAFVVRAQLRPALADELRRGIEARFGAEVWSELDVDGSLPTLGVPGLVVHDRDDDEVPLDDARSIAERWPGAELITTAGLGHRRIVRDATVRAAIVGHVAGVARSSGATHREVDTARAAA